MNVFGSTVGRIGVAAVALFGVATTSTAQVTRLEIASRDSAASGQPFGSAGPYVNVRGRVHGQLDPRDRRNRIIQDLDLAPRNAAGKVEYVATFSLMMPADLAKASGVLVYSVVNRGNGAAAPSPDGHISLVSGWQGDVTPTPNNQTIQVPVARNRDGSAITGPVLARFVDLPAGTTTARSASARSAPPFYAPADARHQPRHADLPHRGNDRRAPPAAKAPSPPIAGRLPTAAPPRSPARRIRRASA